MAIPRGWVAVKLVNPAMLLVDETLQVKFVRLRTGRGPLRQSFYLDSEPSFVVLEYTSCLIITCAQWAFGLVNAVSEGYHG